jgi:hypothetical protein
MQYDNSFFSGIPNTQERTDVSGSPAKRERKIGGRQSGLVEICPIKRGFCLLCCKKDGLKFKINHAFLTTLP